MKVVEIDATNEGKGRFGVKVDGKRVALAYLRFTALVKLACMRRDHGEDWLPMSEISVPMAARNVIYRLRREVPCIETKAGVGYRIDPAVDVKMTPEGIQALRKFNDWTVRRLFE